MDNPLKRLRITIDKITVARNQGKLTLTHAEKHHLSNIKASVRNIIDDGYIGGESGVSEQHIINSYDWCAKLLNKVNN